MENEIKFPSYCCFGKLQSSTICETADEITADYQMFGSVVHKLSYAKGHDSWQIRDLSSDRSSPRVSGGKTMDKAICTHMLFIDDKNDELLSLLRKELFTLGNIWLNPLPAIGKGNHITYSPAGLLMIVRLLLSERGDVNRSLDKLKELPANIGNNVSTELRILESYETCCIINSSNNRKELLKAFIVEFIVPLAFVYDAAKWLKDKKLLGDNRIDRIIIENTSPQEIWIQGFQFVTPDISGETGFTVIMKGILKSKEDYARQLEAVKKEFGG